MYGMSHVHMFRPVRVFLPIRPYDCVPYAYTYVYGQPIRVYRLPIRVWDSLIFATIHTAIIDTIDSVRSL